MTRLMQDQAGAVVRERDRGKLRTMMGVLCLGSLLVGGVLGFVWLRVQTVRVTYQLDELRRVRAQVEERTRQLQLELASLRSFARVDAAARRLGFAPPTPDQVQLAREFVTPEPADPRSASLRPAAKDAPLPGPRGRP
jgi:cell division protein FtsL